jgi:hypothetical protein
MLYTHGSATRPAFLTFMRQLCAGKDGVTLHDAVKLKHFYRAMEKMCLKVGERRYECDSVCDMVRCMVECDSCAAMQEVFELLLAHGGIEVMRVKDRLTHPTPMAWADVMVNFRLRSDANQHVCEVQIVHKKLLLARSGLGGHGPYAKVRAASEILEVLRGGTQAAAVGQQIEAAGGGAGSGIVGGLEPIAAAAAPAGLGRLEAEATPPAAAAPVPPVAMSLDDLGLSGPAPGSSAAPPKNGCCIIV